MLYRGTYEGGCFCGAVRYRLTDVSDAGYCHCSICRRTTGAPVIGWANTPRATFAVTRGTPRFMSSSEDFERAFCPDCGTLMFTQSKDPGRWSNVSVHHGTLDQAAAIEPAVHICWADRLPWFSTTDELPRFDTARIPHPGKRGDPRWQE
jgi:hypothetical protein